MFLDCVLVGCAVEWFILLLVKSVFVFEFGFLVYFLFYSAKQNNGFVFPFYVFDFKQKKQETHVSVISFIDLNRKSIETKVLGPPPPCIPVALCLICASQSGVLHNASYTGPMLVYCSGGLCHAIQQSPDSTVPWVCRCCPSPRQTSSLAS